MRRWSSTPSYAIEPYLEEAERRRVRIVRVLETHTHADHLSGHGRLALEHGLPVSIHPLAEPEYPFDPVEDGDELRVGDVTIRVIHTPGHRPEHCCYLVDGHLMTGDSLLIGDAARPDLAVDPLEGAESLYGSLQRLVELPESTEVDPGHVAGSLCATGISSALSSTIGFERLSNRALSYHDLQEFVAATATSRRLARRRSSGSWRSTEGRSSAPLPRSSRSRPSRARCSTSALPTSSPPATSPARSTCRSPALRRDEGGLPARRRSARGAARLFA